MKTQTLVGLTAALVVALGAWYWFEQSSAPAPTAPVGYKNITVTIDGQPIALVDGRAPSVPGSVSKVVTEYFGNEATGDLNGDGIPDTAFLITQNPGGSGTFYYVVAAIKTPTGYQGTDAVLLGDRIAPQTTEITDGKLIVNYADRAPGEPMTTKPSIGKSLYLKLDPATMQFGIVDQNFSGEADPSHMALETQTWTWVSTQYNDGTTITPKKPKAFTITFAKESFTATSGTISATTDCNSFGGEYTVSGSTITITKGISTLMACQGSQESDFLKAFTAIHSYHFTSKGELIFDLTLDSGIMTFR